MQWSPCHAVLSAPTPGATVPCTMEHLERIWGSSRGTMMGINHVDPPLTGSRAEHVQVPPVGCPQHPPQPGRHRPRAPGTAASFASDATGHLELGDGGCGWRKRGRSGPWVPGWVTATAGEEQRGFAEPRVWVWLQEPQPLLRPEPCGVPVSSAAGVSVRVRAI